jgi:hypothetical protein
MRSGPNDDGGRRRRALGYGLARFAVGILLVFPQASSSATLRVPSQYPTIQMALDAAASRDSILVASGSYEEDVTISTSLITLSGEGRPLVRSFVPVLSVNADSVSIIGFHFNGTTFASGVPTAWLGGSGFRIEDCMFEGGFAGVSVIGKGEILRSQFTRSAHGVRVELGGSGVTLRNCSIFENSAEVFGETLGAGLMILDGNEVELFDCEFVSNSASIAGAAIYASWNPGVKVARVLAERCLIVGNRSPAGSGIETSNAQLTLISCTFASNHATADGGALLQLSESMVIESRIDNCIMAFNEGAALWCPGANNLTVHCSNVFGNSDDSLCASDGGDNHSLDPLFCAIGNFHIAEGSPCSPGESPPGCGLIGALDVQCASAVASSTWGQIKGMYLENRRER